MKPYAEMAKKIKTEVTDTYDTSSPNSDVYPSHTPAITTTVDVPAASSVNMLSLEPVIQPSSLEVIQAEIRATIQSEIRATIQSEIQATIQSEIRATIQSEIRTEIREAIQGFGEQYGSDLSERIARFNQKLETFSIDQLFDHMTQLTSLAETARKTVTTLAQVSTTRDFITARNQMIETRLANETTVSTVTGMVDTLKYDVEQREKKRTELFEKLERNVDMLRRNGEQLKREQKDWFDWFGSKFDALQGELRKR